MLDTEQPAVVQDSSAPETTAQETIFDSPTETQETELPEQQPEDEIEEELEGVKLRGKKELLEKIKSERLMQADYTRKTQEVAEQRKQFEAQVQQFQQIAQAQQANLQDHGRLTAIDERLAQFQSVNWAAWADQDPQAAQKAHMEFTQLQAHRGQLVQTLTQRQQQLAMEQQRENARLVQEGRAVLARDIKGWSPELAGKLVEFGVSMGIPRDTLDNVTNPTLVKLLHRAYIGDQLEKQKTQASRPTPQAPVTKVGGGSASNTKKLSELTDEEFVRRRREYVKNHR